MSSSQSKSLLEDVKRDLNIDNSIIRNQALSRLAKFTKSAIAGSKINEKSDKLPCVQLLWECVTHDSQFVCDGSATIWIHLITNRQAEFAYVVNGFVHRSLSSNYEKSVVVLPTLTKLLFFQLHSDEKYIYQIKCPVHPFTVLIQQKAELWPAVLAMIKCLLRSEKKLEAYISLLPVFKYVLWKSPQSNLKGYKISLANDLWDCMKISNSVCFQSFMWKTLFWLNASCMTSALEVQSEICQWLKNYFQQLELHQMSTSNAEDILFCVASCGKTLIGHQIDICDLSFYMKLLAERLKNEAATETSDSSLMIILQMIDFIPQTGLPLIFKICELVALRKGTNLFVNRMFLIKVVIHLNNCEQSKSFTNGSEQIMATTLRLLHDLESVLESEGPTKSVTFVSASSNLFEAASFNEVSLTALQTIKLCRQFCQSPENVTKWLDEVILVLEYSNTDGFCELLYSITCAIVLQTSNIEILERCLTILVKMVNLSTSKAPDAFAILLYKLKIEKNPWEKLLICQTIPRLATSKICVGPILKSLSAFYEEPTTRSLALRLMCSLWQQQERVYPVLYKWIIDVRHNEIASSGTGINEIYLAKAASIFQVCSLKSHLHGSDLLTILSKLVTFGTSLADTSTVVLALESIIVLCRESVIDLKTTWTFLLPLLKKEKRSSVQIRMCELLSLASELEEGGQDDFLEESLERLWKFGLDDNATVACNAFKCLSKFKKAFHQLKHLPQYIIDGIKFPKKLATSKDDEDEVLRYIPGSCFVELLINLPSSVISGYGELMCGLVLQEVREMPRSLLHLSSSSKLSNSQTKGDTELKQISKLLTETYRSNYSNSFKSSLTVGLLFAFDAHVDSGKISRHFIVNKGRSYSEKLEKFLFNVLLDIREWRSMLLYSTAWNNFIESHFLSMIETRELQIEQYQIQDGISNAEVLKMESSLWARDKITEILKNAARVDPVAHGNAMLALAGLVRAVYKYNLMTDITHREGSEYIDHRHWMLEVTRVICKCLEPQTALISGAFTWCFPGSGDVSQKVRDYVALAVPSLSLTLINSDQDVIDGLFHNLFDGLDFSSICELKNFCWGLGLGQLICNLITEYSCEKILFTNVLTKWKDYCFKDENLKLRCGGVLGFCIATSAFCQVFSEDSQLIVEQVLMTLNKNFEYELLSDEILSLGLVMVMTSATSANIISSDLAKALADSWSEKSQQDLKAVLPFGLLVKFLSAVNEKYVDVKNDLLSKLINSVKEENVQKIATLHGLFSLTVGFEMSSVLKQLPVKLKELEDTRDLLNDLASKSTEGELPPCCFWMLGCLHWKISQLSGSSNEGPTDYRFLDDQSILKPLVRCLQHFSKSGIKTEEDKAVVIVCLKCLGLKSLQPYPNLNWDFLLSPLFNSSQDIQKLCVDVAIERANRSVSAKIFVTSLMTPNTFSSLFTSTQFYLLERLDQVMSLVNPNIIKMFLKMYINSIFRLNPKEALQLQFLKGLHQAVQLKDRSQIISSMMYSSLSEIFIWVTMEKQTLWNYFCQVIACLDENQLEDLAGAHKGDEDIFKIAHLLCEMVGIGKLALNRLNECIESLSYCDLEKKSMRHIYESFLTCFRHVRKHCVEIDRLNWILELMGYIRIIAQSEAESTSKAVTVLFNLFSCAICSWTDLQVQIFDFCTSIEDLEFPCPNLSLSWLHLNKHSVWKSQNRKMLEFLFFLFHSSQTDNCLKIYIKECLFNFRHFEEFKSSATWIRLLEVVDERELQRDDPAVSASKRPPTTTSDPPTASKSRTSKTFSSPTTWSADS